MKSFFISLVIVLSLSLTIATAQDTLKIDERIVNLEKRIEQLESMTSYLTNKVEVLQARLDSMVVVLDEPTPAKATQTTGKEKTKENQCKAVTKKGTRCTRIVTDGSGYCWQHKK